ncbi:hypothetical protein ACQ4LK_24965, partial [Bacillus pumilus]
MKYDHILVRFGEISTKGKNRKKFIEKLRQHIRFESVSYTHLTMSLIHYSETTSPSTCSV